MKNPHDWISMEKLNKEGGRKAHILFEKEGLIVYVLLQFL